MRMKEHGEAYESNLSTTTLTASASETDSQVKQYSPFPSNPRDETTSPSLKVKLARIIEAYKGAVFTINLATLRTSLENSSLREICEGYFIGPHDIYSDAQCSHVFGTATTAEEALAEPQVLALLDDVIAPPLDASWGRKLLGTLKDVLLEDLVVDEHKDEINRDAFAIPKDWVTLMELTNGLRGPGLPFEYVCDGEDYLYSLSSSIYALKRDWRDLDMERPSEPVYLNGVKPSTPHLYHTPPYLGAQSTVEELILRQNIAANGLFNPSIKMWDVVTAWEIGGSNAGAKDFYVWYAYLRHKQEKDRFEWKVLMWQDFVLCHISDNLVQYLEFLTEKWIPV
jgi:hypothetical protein